jgi:hypothetical protein
MDGGAYEAVGEDLGIWEGASIPAEHWHFHRRVFERYRMVLPPGAFSKMLRRLLAGPSKDAQRIGWNLLTGRETWGVYVSDGRVPRLLYVVWHPRRRAVITALPQSSWRYARFQRAREAFRETRRSRRLPVPIRLPGFPALLGRAAQVLTSRPAGSVRNLVRVEESADRRVPFLTFEMTVEREVPDCRPAPLGHTRSRVMETVFFLRAVLFRSEPQHR